MQADFWHQRWQDNQTGFHLEAPHPLLVANFKADAQSTVFVPLCGKTLDIGWLMAQDYRVVAIELSEIAVKALFENLGLTPNIRQQGALSVYEIDQLTVYVGDIFSLTINKIGPVDYIYDRAALVALPPEMRTLYTQHLMSLTRSAPQFVILIEYDQSLIEGPPFSIDETILSDYYQAHYDCEKFAIVPIEDGLKGKVPANEVLWQLSLSDG